MNTDTETWIVTFGVGTRHAKQYTEVVVDTVEQVDCYDHKIKAERHVGDHVPGFEREARARAAAVESYGNSWADIYSPRRPPRFLSKPGYTLRERIGARRPDDSLVPVDDRFCICGRPRIRREATA